MHECTRCIVSEQTCSLCWRQVRLLGEAWWLSIMGSCGMLLQGLGWSGVVLQALVTTWGWATSGLCSTYLAVSLMGFSMLIWNSEITSLTL